MGDMLCGEIENTENMEKSGVAGGLVNVWRDLCVNLTDVRIAPQRDRGDGWQGEV